MPIKKNAKEKIATGKRRRGAPRTVSPDPDQCHELGEEMLLWVKLNNPTHLSEWYSLEKMIPWKTWNAMCELQDFLPYYETALNYVAKNARNGTLDKSIAQRFLALYHRDLRQYDHEELTYQSNLKSQEAQNISEADVKRFESMMALIADKQK